MELSAGFPVHDTATRAGFTRRSLMKRTVGLGALTGVAALVGDAWLDSAYAYADVATVGLGSGTAPEQVHLTWGDEPTSTMTVSWAAPQAMPAASLVYGTSSAVQAGVGTVTAQPYTDGMNGETVHNYHAQLTGLTPATTYFYTISDGAIPPNIVSASFTTAPAGRASYVFSSFGDLATPSREHSASGYQWNESSDNAYWAVQELERQTPLFHLLNGDLCYANLNTNNQPEVWRDFGVNNQVSAKNRPWMPCLGNHEIEFGATDRHGNGVAGGNGGSNGAYGYLSYQSRYVLPGNGVSGYQGNFYCFQVGTVLFISLDGDDVAYQDAGANYLPGSSTSPLTATNPAISIPAGTTLYNNQYTGPLTVGPDNSLVADTNNASYNRQTAWLAEQLHAARAAGSGVDMIVVQMHQCALSSSAAGNGSDLGIRQAWIPLFDAYSVDIVVNGHDHNYERTYPVRGYVPGANGTVISANPGQAASGSPVDTRLPQRALAAGPFTTTVNGASFPTAFDTSQGTVYLTLGGGGTDGPTNTFTTTTAGPPQAKVITQRNQVVAKKDSNGATTGYTRNTADSTEPAAWSAARDDEKAYGFAIFSVDPGSGPGQTSITMNYLHAGQTGAKDANNPAPTNTGTNYQGSDPGYSSLETVVFGRDLPQTTPPTALPEFGSPALAAAAGLAVGGAALVAARRRATGG